MTTKSGSNQILFGVLLAVALVFAACTSSGNNEAAPDPTTAESSSTTTSEPPEDSNTTGSNTGDTDLAGGEEPDLLALEELWGQLWTASGLVPDERAPAIALLGDAIHPIVAEGVPTMLLETTEREVHTYPVFELDSDGSTINIRDCIIYVPQIFESITHIHSGTAIPDGSGGWIIDSVARETRGCIPAELNTQILEDYAAYNEAATEYWNPPDPDHPGINATLTGELQELIRARVESDKDAGYVFIDETSIFKPELVEVLSNTSVSVRDCVQVDEHSGLFEADSGERVDGIEARIAGSRDLWSIRMTLEDGAWKVEEAEAVFNADCQPSPTQAALPPV